MTPVSAGGGAAVECIWHVEIPYILNRRGGLSFSLGH